MIPTEATDILKFTPDVFKDVEGAPTFLLRAPDDRHVRRYNLVCGEMNLEQFSAKVMNVERRKAIVEIYGDNGRAYLERFNSILLAAEQGIEVSADDQLWIDHISDQLFDQWPPLARMKAKNREYYEWAPEVCMTTMLTGWTGVDTEFKKDGLYADAKTVGKAVNEMAARERALPGHQDDAQLLSYVQLWAACQNQMFLTEDEEKNSPAPSQLSSTQNASTENSTADGESIEASGEDKSASTSSPQTLAKQAGAKA